MSQSVLRRSSTPVLPGLVELDGLEHEEGPDEDHEDGQPSGAPVGNLLWPREVGCHAEHFFILGTRETIDVLTFQQTVSRGESWVGAGSSRLGRASSRASEGCRCPESCPTPCFSLFPGKK